MSNVQIFFSVFDKFPLIFLIIFSSAEKGILGRILKFHLVIFESFSSSTVISMAVRAGQGFTQKFTDLQRRDTTENLGRFRAKTTCLLN